MNMNKKSNVFNRFHSKYLISKSSPLLITFFALFSPLMNQAAPWPGYGETQRVKLYTQDVASHDNYAFGPLKTFTGYSDPNFHEASLSYNPLHNNEYKSYNLIIVVNKGVLKNGERPQSLRFYDRNALNNGYNGLIYYWLVSTGIKGYETPSGFFTPQSFSSRHWSGQFDAPMLNSVFFSDGKAFHTSIDTEAMFKLGEPFSHGCIHLEDYRATDLFHRIGQGGYGLVDQINKKTGRVIRDSSGNPIKAKGYKTLIVIY